jgi:hypothetical protein
VCPRWRTALDAILAGDAKMVQFVCRLFGAALAGEVIDHVLPILHGSGSNGKSLLTETMLEVFGDYADKASSDLLLVKHGESHPTEKADLFGKRLVFAVETDEGRRLSESLTKELTGGDTIKARRMREDFWSFKPQHTVVLVTNHKPRVAGTDHAMWRRLTLVPFTTSNCTRMASCLLQSFTERRIDIGDDLLLLQNLRRLSIVEKPWGVKLEAPRGPEGHADIAFAFAISLMPAMDWAMTYIEPIDDGLGDNLLDEYRTPRRYDGTRRIGI